MNNQPDDWDELEETRTERDALRDENRALRERLQLVHRVLSELITRLRP